MLYLYVEIDIILNVVISVRSESKTFAYFESRIRTKGRDWGDIERGGRDH